MITELAMSTGWDFERIMAMKMPTFVMFSRHARKLEEDKFSRLLMELCDVVAVAKASNEYHEALKGHYLNRLLDEGQRKKRNRPFEFDMDKKDQADAAANILAATLAKKKQLMGLSSGRK